MAMSFKVEKKGERFMVVNESTGYVKGRFKTEGEAKIYRDRIQKDHDTALDQVSSRLTPPSADEPAEE